MFFTAANLYGGMFGKQLAARLWELDGQRVVALGCPGGASWMLGTANCLNGAVITLVLNYLIGPLFLFLVSLICIYNYYHCNEKNNRMRKKKNSQECDHC